MHVLVGVIVLVKVNEGVKLIEGVTDAPGVDVKVTDGVGDAVADGPGVDVLDGDTPGVDTGVSAIAYGVSQDSSDGPDCVSAGVDVGVAVGAGVDVLVGVAVLVVVTVGAGVLVGLCVGVGVGDVHTTILDFSRLQFFHFNCYCWCGAICWKIHFVFNTNNRAFDNTFVAIINTSRVFYNYRAFCFV